MGEKGDYRRILVKLSGETVSGSASGSIDAEACQATALRLKALHNEGYQVAVVIGGGNIFRGADRDQLGLDRTPADQIGMLATLINGIVLEQTLIAAGTDARVMTAIQCPRIAEAYQLRRALRHMQMGRILIFAGGTGNPYFTTDSAAALRAAEIDADLLIKATKVDGIYDKDPLKHSDAKRYDTVSYSQALAENLQVMDATAIALCRENTIPILVFNIFGDHEIAKVIKEHHHGTLVTGE